MELLGWYMVGFGLFLSGFTLLVIYFRDRHLPTRRRGIALLLGLALVAVAISVVNRIVHVWPDIYAPSAIISGLLSMLAGAGTIRISELFRFANLEIERREILAGLRRREQIDDSGGSCDGGT